MAGRQRKKISRFTKWCQITSCHGWADWERTKYILKKIVWTALILIAFALLSLFLFELIASYFQNEKWTTNVYETPKSERVLLPYLTICNYNRIQRRLIEEFGLDPKWVPIIYAPLLPMEYAIANLDYSTELKNNLAEWMKNNNMTTKDIFMNLTQSCEDLFVMAKLGLKVMGGKEICGSPFIRKILNLEFGACFQINGSAILQQVNLGGSSSMLTLFLNSDPSQMFPTIENNFLEEGFALGFDYTPLVRGRWVTISPGFRSRIGLQAQRTTLSKTSFIDPFFFEPPCEKNPDMKIYSNEHFSLNLCNSDCYQQEVILSCGCVNAFETKKYPLCQTIELIDCLQSHLASGDSLKRMVKCQSKCKEPCTDETVESRITMTRLSPLAQLALVKTLKPSANPSVDDISLAGVDIYFETTKVKVINYFQVVTASNLISNIGGQMGLWAGISVLTFIQFIIHFCCPDDGEREVDDRNSFDLHSRFK